MSDSNNLFIGLISGTSADAIDAVLVDFSASTPKLIAQLGATIPSDIQSAIYQLMVPGDNEIDRLGVLDQQLGEIFAQAVLDLLAQTSYSTKQITAIGSHGQTIRHRPPGELARAFTLQIADPNVIAEKTGITTVADFRRRDMAAAGQGAPLVPAFHRAVFGSPTTDRAIVNIGGIGNITYLPKDGSTLGFDTGPGNALMDLWMQKHHNKSYDKDGQWAAQGRSHSDLLSKLLAHPYFALTAPKSTGREMFTADWLNSVLVSFPDISPVDVQATLLNLTAHSIATELSNVSGKNNMLEVYVCGGGAYNGALMSRLSELLAPMKVGITSQLGIAPDWVEAAAFAWLAKQTMEKKPGNLASVTGATGERILGGVYFI